MKKKEILDLVYPIYRIRINYRLETINNITYIDSYTGSYILDNKNLSGNFIARRNKITSDVYPLYKPLLSHKDLILSKNTTNKFVDSEGYVFTYKKTRFVPIIYYPIKDRKYIGNYIIFTVQNLNCKFHAVLNHKIINSIYIGLIHIDNGYVFYSLTDEKQKNTRIKI